MTPVSPAMPTPFASPASPRKLSMRHIPLIYNTINGRMSCRMCQARCDEFRDQQDVPFDKRPKPYILSAATATWDEMAGHCERVHPKAYEGLINMTPDQMRVKEQQFGLCGRASRK
ncbi:uncharacterized protein TRAVEDRAFT_57357 [Trametes versicolor FP-101664 SS1]|uniref:uncharacterized protein n=1 Tax=Trametes versicolor (strain FP-101664) TaxID=717944 RepID=UPI00046244FF|nr:uncharacterized protein TRAVEDRAFT_57357 [Trametes versicolor FP-101664 SS1]EIW62373.1 hypothetical protein TRAVEDRAFT_57357 [Trametes versicolor FP-101664 SS1]